MVRYQKIKKIVLIGFLLFVLGCAQSEPSRESTARFSVDKDPIAKILSLHQDRFKKCYDYSFEMKPGIVRLAFSIDASGDVQDPEIKSSTLNNNEVETCCVSVVRTISFAPKTEDDPELRLFEYPIEFGAY